jgi:uncharacterized protein YdhG (YjbR/CyaY superfamily)
MKKPISVDDYISAQPAKIAERLLQIQKVVKKAAPDATEKLSYSMPYYALNGSLLYFMSHKHHIGFYPMKSAITKFSKDLEGYKTHVATVQFPHDKPLPLPLIKRIVAFRVKEQRAKI